MCLPPLSKCAPAKNTSSAAAEKRNKAVVAPLPSSTLKSATPAHVDVVVAPQKNPAVVELDFSWLSDYQSLPSPTSYVPELESIQGLPSDASGERSPIDEVEVPLDEDFAERSGSTQEVPSKKTRKRKLVSDLSPEELARMREVNRVAAQRHRCLAKQKMSDQQQRTQAISQRNAELKRQIHDLSAELGTLKRVVLSMYTGGQPRNGPFAYM